MFTVVIAEQEHLNSIREFELFLKPFLDNPNIAFCTWQKDALTLEEAVPELNDTVMRHEHWRMIVVCDEEGLTYKNPFDLARYEDPVQPRDMDDDTYRTLRREARVAAYTRSAERPLVRLMTWLCKQPLVTDGSALAYELDPEFREYMLQARVKEGLRGQILGDQQLQITLPDEIYCLAQRCYEREEQDIREAWAEKPDSHPSRFCDWNLYFDKQRFLVFDILPKNHRNYPFDYIRFLNSLLLLAGNEVPMGAMKPHGLYELETVHDEGALRRVLSRYDAMLGVTEEKIRAQVTKLRGEILPRLSDADAETIFRARMNIPVSAVKSFDYSTLYVPRDGIGLASDCPENEQDRWASEYQGVQTSLGKLMKLPRRILHRTTSELHRLNRADLTQAGRLNEFQLEDIRSFVEEEELKMVATVTGDFNNTQRYTDAMETQHKHLSDVLSRRVGRNWIIGLGVLGMLCYLAGFLPLLLGNASRDENATWCALMALCGTGVLALAALVTLLLQWRKVRKAYSGFNGTMRGIILDVEGGLKAYSKYLSHACNVMRGNSVLEFCENAEAPHASKIRILKKHEMDVCCIRAELQETFGQFLDQSTVNPDDVSCYPYDFCRPTEYVYPIPFRAGMGSRIDFFQKGNLVEVPVDFIKSVHIRREALYE